MTRNVLVQYVNLDFSSLSEVFFDGGQIELYRDQIRHGAALKVPSRISRYGGRVLVLTENGRLVAEAYRLENRAAVVAEIVE
jgi:hypothetical protein